MKIGGVFMQIFIKLCVISISVIVFGCAHKQLNPVSEEEAARLDRTLVREAVIYEPGSKDGAVVPDISAPRLHAIWVPERQESGRLIEAHREWAIEGDVVILGIPKTSRKLK